VYPPVGPNWWWIWDFEGSNRGAARSERLTVRSQTAPVSTWGSEQLPSAGLDFLVILRNQFIHSLIQWLQRDSPTQRRVSQVFINYRLIQTTQKKFFEGQVKLWNCFRRIEKLVLPFTFDTSLSSLMMWNLQSYPTTVLNERTVLAWWQDVHPTPKIYRTSNRQRFSFGRLAWINIRKNRPVKQMPAVVTVTVESIDGPNPPRPRRSASASQYSAVSKLL